MSYDKRSTLRKECQRYVRFSYLIDLLAINALTQIYFKSLNVFIEEISELNKQDQALFVREEEKAKPLGYKDPLFKLKIKEEISKLEGESTEIEIVKTKMKEFKFPKPDDEEVTNEHYENYNLITFPFLIQYDEVENFNE